MPDDPLEVEFEEWHVMNFEQPVGDVDADEPIPIR